MANAEVFVFLLLAVAVLAGLGLRSGVPYPVALVVGGLAIGLTPGLPSPALGPDVVFFAFLPPLVYSAAFTAREVHLRQTARLQAEMIAAEREVLRRMRRERAFPADVLRDLAHELDLDDSRLRARAPDTMER